MATATSASRPTTMSGGEPTQATMLAGEEQRTLTEPTWTVRGAGAGLQGGVPRMSGGAVVLGVGVGEGDTRQGTPAEPVQALTGAGMGLPDPLHTSGAPACAAVTGVQPRRAQSGAAAVPSFAAQGSQSQVRLSCS